MPTDKLDVTANVDGEKVNDGVFPLTDMDQADKNPHHVSYNYEGRDKRDTLGSSLRVAYDAPWFKVTSITAYRGYNDVTRNDQDFTPYDLITAREDIKDRQFTQEFRFASPEGSGPLKWLGGLYLYKKHQDHTLDLNYGQGAADMGMVPMAMTNAADSDIKTYGYAVFGQATYTLFDKLDLTAGLRYEYEKNKLDYALGLSRGRDGRPRHELGHQRPEARRCVSAQGADRLSLDAGLHDLRRSVARLPQRRFQHEFPRCVGSGL